MPGPGGALGPAVHPYAPAVAADASSTTRGTEPEGTNPARLLVGIVAGAILLGRFGGPLSDWIGAVGTAAHEAGHALAADLLTGRVVSITVFPDGGGVTYSTTSASAWRTFLVSGAGYPATLVAGLALLTGVLVARSSRSIAVAGALAAAVALVFWTPFDAPPIPGIENGDQRFTWFVFAALTVALAGAAAVPHRHDQARRVVLGIVAVGLLSDALAAGKDLVVIEGDGRLAATATDADALAEASGIASATVWAWIVRLGLFLGFVAWGVAVLRYWARLTARTSTRAPTP